MRVIRIRQGWAVLIAFMIGVTGQAFAKKDAFSWPHVPGELIVKFDDATRALMAEREIGLKAVRSYRNGAQLVKFQNALGDVLSESELQAKAEQIAQIPGVVYVEPNYTYQLFDVPNDPSFSKLYGLHNDGQTGGKVDADIDAPEAWNITKGSRDIIVGVHDTGCDYTHPDLKDNIWTNPGETGLDAKGRDKATNGVDDDGNGYVDDVHGYDFINNDNDPMDGHGHGTHVSGTIGAVGGNGVGVVGVNWYVTIVCAKIFTDAGSTNEDAIIRAIEYTTQVGVRLTSDSWGGGAASQGIQDAIKEANDKGILFIAAAGNDGSDNDATPSYPANYAIDNIISVAANDHNDGLASFSNWGKTMVDVSAPGVDIYSTMPGNRYGKMSGTSMATPHVSGVAALVWSAFPNATAAQIKARIINTVDPIPAFTNKMISGGRVNVNNALDNDTIAPAPVDGLAVTATGLNSVSLSWNAAGDDDHVGKATRYEVRYAATAITDEAAWNAASRTSASISLAADPVITAELTGLNFNQNGFIAVRAFDNVGNTSDLSASVAFATKVATVVFQNDGESMGGVTADINWGVEPGLNGNAFSDSPGVKYKASANNSLTMPAVTVDNDDVTLAISTKFDTEDRYDFCYVEISTNNGASWTQLDKFAGSRDWHIRSYSLKGKLGGALTFKTRFHFTSDSSNQGDGWFIDNVTVYAAEP